MTAHREPFGNVESPKLRKQAQLGCLTHTEKRNAALLFTDTAALLQQHPGEEAMPHPTTLVFGTLFIAKAFGFAFVGVSPTLDLVGKWTPRSTSASLACSQTVRRVRRTTLEPKQDRRHQDSRSYQGSTRDTRRATSIPAAAYDGDDGEEIVPARYEQHLRVVSN